MWTFLSDRVVVSSSRDHWLRCKVTTVGKLFTPTRRVTRYWQKLRCKHIHHLISSTSHDTLAPISVVLQHKLVSGWGLQVWSSAPHYLLIWLGNYFMYYIFYDQVDFPVIKWIENWSSGSREEVALCSLSRNGSQPWLPGRGTNLYMAQLMPLPLTISLSSKSRLVLPFWYQLTRVVPDKRPLNGCHCCIRCNEMSWNFSYHTCIWCLH